MPGGTWNLGLPELIAIAATVLVTLLFVGSYIHDGKRVAKYRADEQAKREADRLDRITPPTPEQIASYPKFCRECGAPTRYFVEEEVAPSKYGEMRAIVQCVDYAAKTRTIDAALGHPNPHYQKTVKRWNAGPKFDPMTGAKLRD